MTRDQPADLTQDLGDTQMVCRMVWDLVDQGEWVVPVLEPVPVLDLGRVGLAQADSPEDLVQESADLNSVVRVDQGLLVRTRT